MAAPKSTHRTLRQRRVRRSAVTRCENTRNHRMYHVIFVWGSHDAYPRRYSTYGRREAFRSAQEIAEKGARIVLVKKGTDNTGMKLIADFSTVGGA